MAKKNFMRSKLLLLICLSFVLAMVPVKEPKMTDIFNGKNLKGWIVPESNIWCSAGNGLLSVKSGPDK